VAALLRGWLPIGLAAALVVGCGSSPAAPSPFWTYSPHHAATDQLADIIEEISAADGYRYDPHDDRGNDMDAPKVIQAPDGGFVAVYHSWDEVNQQFVTHLATSINLLDWNWQTELGRNASQPTIAEATDGGYVVGWEQEPPNHLFFAHFPTFDDLLGARPAKTYEPPTQLSPNCAEGTPSFYEASSTRLDVAFHYFRDCTLDRQARGTTDWTTWTSSPQPVLDAAIERRGVEGGIGDRDGPFTFEDYDYLIFEGMRVPGQWETFRVFLYDVTTDSARQLQMQTHGGSHAFTNPTISRVTLDGREAIVLSMFIPSEGSAEGEAGGVIYYRFIKGVETPDG
jgi:hypothetical protein